MHKSNVSPTPCSAPAAARACQLTHEFFSLLHVLLQVPIEHDERVELGNQLLLPIGHGLGRPALEVRRLLKLLHEPLGLLRTRRAGQRRAWRAGR